MLQQCYIHSRPIPMSGSLQNVQGHRVNRATSNHAQTLILTLNLTLTLNPNPIPEP